MQNRFKFRVWNVSDKKYSDWEYLRLCADLGDILNRGNTQCQIIEQCTGLTDKNGKLIYEGDVAEHRGIKYVIKYLDKYARFAFTNSSCVFSSGFVEGSDFEIIGNTHQNSELLESEAV